MNNLTFDLNSILMLAADGTEYSDEQFTAELMIDGRSTRLEVDSGAAVTVIDESMWRDIGEPKLSSTSAVCRSFTGQQIALRGRADVNVKYGGKSSRLHLFVTEKGDCVLGRTWIRALGLTDLSKLNNATTPRAYVHRLQDDTSIGSLINEFSDVFEPGLGHCRAMKAHLELKEDARPVFARARPLPYATYDATSAEIDRLQAEGVIEPVNFAEWAVPIVVVAKEEGKIRLCADFSVGVNDALNVHQYPLPRPADLFHRLNGGKIFTKIDFASAYHQVEMDEQSKKILVINTHKGLFRFNRLPFGIASAPAIFQQVMEKTLAGIPGVGIYLDDIIISAADETTHLRRLRQVLTRIRRNGFRIQKKKCEFGKSSIDYLGFVVDQHGRHTSPSKTAAIERMPAPTNLAELRALLGFINHYAVFLPQLATRLSPMHRLLRKDDKGKFPAFKWSPECEKAFAEVKKSLLSPLMVHHYDPTLPIVVSADASPFGVGAMLAHRLPDGREVPVAHASRTMTATETRYPQVEREALALLFAVRKFHTYIYGREFILRTDHQPLTKIFGSKRGLPTTSVNRLHNYAVTLMAYRFTIEYVRGEAFSEVDGLSRLPLKDEKASEEEKEVTLRLNVVFKEKLSELPVKADAVAEATKKDQLLQRVVRFHQQGWPNRLTGADKEKLLPFFKIRYELAVMHDCILWGLRTIIPEALRQQVLRQLHESHPGKVGMQRLARRYLWWPGLDADVQRVVNECDKCIRCLPDPPRSPPQPWIDAVRPWQRIHVDFAGPFEGAMWLIVIDAHSRWPEVAKMSIGQTTTAHVIFELSKLFARYGFAETVVSDNGRQFASDAFAEWCRSHGVTHRRTTPYQPQSNGLAERFVGSFKQAMLKSGGGEEGTEVRALKYLQRYRITPHPATDKAPAELFLGRTPRSQFDLLFPVDMHNLEREKEKRKLHGERGEEEKITVGAAVLIREYKDGQRAGWLRGTVVGRQGKVIWLVKPLDREDVWRRHTNQLRPAHPTRVPESAANSRQADEDVGTERDLLDNREADAGSHEAEESERESEQEDAPAEQVTPPTPRRSTRTRQPARPFTPV